MATPASSGAPTVVKKGDRVVYSWGSAQRFGGILPFTDDDALVMSRNLWDEDAMGTLMVPTPDGRMGGQQQFEIFAKHRLQYQTPPAPPWLATTLREFCEGISFNWDHISLSSTFGTRRATGLIAPDELLPMERFFEFDDPSSVAFLQARLFLAWGLLADEGAHQAGFSKFVERVRKEPVSEQMFKACFGLDFYDVRERLKAQLAASGTRQKPVVLRVSGLPAPPASSSVTPRRLSLRV